MKACFYILIAMILSAVSHEVVAQSGCQTIQGTRVFTEVFQSQGFARFSNECGSQTLTQGQLQAGAIPNDIIPCPRRGSDVPRSNSGDSRQICTDGSRCPSGHLCMQNNRCIPFNSERYCGGRSYCDAGSACAEKGKCLSVDSPRYCGNKTYCSEGSVCAEKGKCIPATSERYCGNKRYCGIGFACAEEGKCLSVDSERYCGKGKYCAEGAACVGEGECISVNASRYCGGRRYCPLGFSCVDGKTCTQIATAAPSPADDPGCERDNKTNVEWVLFADKGARARFEAFRSSGRSDFEAVVAAQAHNPPVQAGLRKCMDWVISYLTSRGFDNRSDQPKTDAEKPPDCRCVSVVPTGAVTNADQGREYNVTNSCSRMGLSVRLTDKANSTLSTWINVGDIEGGGARIIHAPQAYTVPSIAGIEVRGQRASQVCSFF